MTDDTARLDAIEARAKAATPGPWNAAERHDGSICGIDQLDGMEDVLAPGEVMCGAHCLGGTSFIEAKDSDWRHIAGLDPETALWLVGLARASHTKDAEIKALRDENARLKSWLPERLMEEPVLFWEGNDPRHSVGVAENLRTYCVDCSGQAQEWITPNECPQLAALDVPLRLASAVEFEAAQMARGKALVDLSLLAAEVPRIAEAAGAKGVGPLTGAQLLSLVDDTVARVAALSTAVRERDDARAALDRVNDLADKWAGYGDPVSVGAADQLRAAIEGRS